MTKSEELRELEREVREKTFGYILTALGLVAGLAWNEAITALITAFFPLEKDSLPAKFVYAVVITVIVVGVSMALLKLNKKKDE